MTGSLQTESTKGVVRIDVDGPVWMCSEKKCFTKKKNGKKEGEGADTQASVWRLVVPYVALAPVARRSRGYAVRQTPTPGRGRR